MRIKANTEIITNPNKFRETFLSQITESVLNEKYDVLLKVVLYYIWRGICKNKEALVKGEIQIDLGILCMAIFMSFLPIIQNLRLGYASDAIILLRALMERIALLGYLQANPDLIVKYKIGDNKLQPDAMKWAKVHSLENWMILYSVFTNVAHAKKEAVAGYILSKNPISETFRSSIFPPKNNIAESDDEIFSMFFYALLAIDPIAAKVIGSGYIQIDQSYNELLEYLNQSELLEFRIFLGDLTSKYTKPNT